MKVILKFDLPEETSEYLTCVNASNLSSIIWGLDQWLKDEVKYNPDCHELTINAYNKVRDQLREIMESNSLSFEHQVFS